MKRRVLSLERKLPLLMTGVLAIALAVFLLLTNATLERMAKEGAATRLERATQQLAALASASSERLRARVAAAADDPAIARALAAVAQGGTTDTAALLDAARAALRPLLTPPDTLLPVELWTADARRIAAVGDPATGTPEKATAALESGVDPRLGLDRLHGDSVHFGSPYLADGRVRFWAVAPVERGGRRLGYVALQRAIESEPQTLRTIQGLSGGDVSAYYRDLARPFWTTIGGTVVAPPSSADSAENGVIVVERPESGERLSAEAAIAGTSIAVVLEMPLHGVLARTRRTVTSLIILALCVLAGGAALTWLISRRITRPLARVSDAAETIAAGNYAVRVPVDRGDEIGRLATSFNRMAAEVGASRDQLEQAILAAEEREAELRALTDAIPQLAWMAHPDGYIFWYNQRWYEYTGTTPEEMAGWGWQSVHDPAILPRVLERWRASIATGEPFEMEFPLRAKSGEFRWFLTRVEPVRDRTGRVLRWFGTNTDVQALREVREAAQSANRAKSDFLATMSHELRTPLNAIGGYVELLEMGLRGPLNDEQRRDLARIRASQEHLLNLIGAVLDLSRIESGRVAYRLEPVGLDPFLAGLDALVAPQAAAKSLVLEYVPCPAELTVMADREKLRQVMLNLLSNAIRYTPGGGRIVLTAKPSGDAEVEIAVADTGIGIPPDKLEEIFEPFVQLDRSLTHSREGIGLGLAISRDLARGMGGELSADSDVGRGSRFVLRLPRGVATPAAMRLSGEMPAAGAAS